MAGAGVKEGEKPDGSIAAASELCQALFKALRAFRLYAEGHGSRGDFLGRAHAKLDAFVEQFGALVLDVGAHALSIGADEVYADAEDGSDALAHTLFLDGVQRLLFGADIAAAELDTTLRLWSAAIGQLLPEGRSFSTEIWEADLPHVRVVSLESLVEDDEEATDRRETVAAVLAEMTGDAAAPPSGGQAARPLLASELAALWDVEAVAKVDREALRRLDEAGRAPIADLSAEALAALGAETTSPADRPLDRLLLTVWDVLPLATPEERGRAVALGTRALETRLDERRYDEVRRACFRVIAARTPAREADVALLLAPLAMASTVARLTGDLDDRVHGPGAEALLRFLPRATHGLLIDALGTLARMEARKRLQAILGTMKPDPALLAARAGSAPAGAIAAILALAEATAPAEALRVTAAALGNPAAEARIEALGRVPRAALPALREALQRLRDDPDAEVRRRLTTLLLGARDPAAVPALAARLEDEATPVTERRTIIRALVMYRGPAAAAALRAEFQAKRDVSVRIACAHALAEIGDEESRPILRAARYKLLNPIALRHACEEAMNRLDGALHRG